MADRAMNPNDMGVQEDLDALKNDLRQMKDDVASLGQDFVRLAKGSANEARARVSNMAGQQWESLRDYTGGASEWGRDTFDTLQQKIEERPVVAALAALGIGMILGKIFLPGGGHRR